MFLCSLAGCWLFNVGSGVYEHWAGREYIIHVDLGSKRENQYFCYYLQIQSLSPQVHAINQLAITPNIPQVTEQNITTMKNMHAVRGTRARWEENMYTLRALFNVMSSVWFWCKSYFISQTQTLEDRLLCGGSSGSSSGLRKLGGVARWLALSAWACSWGCALARTRLISVL